MFKSKWLNLVLDVNFMTLNILKVDLFLHIPWIHYKLEGIITQICRKHQSKVILAYFKQSLDNHLFNITYFHTTRVVF